MSANLFFARTSFIAALAAIGLLPAAVYGSSGSWQSPSQPVTVDASPSADGSPSFSSRPTIGVEACVQQALAAHPKITAARARILAAQQRIPQVTALPDPMAETMFFPIQSLALQTADGRMTDQIGIKQDIPLPAKLRAEGSIAGHEVQMAWSELTRAELDVAESVRLAYYELWFATRAIDIVTQSQNLVTSLISVSEARYRAGGSQQDVIRAQVESAKLDQRLLDLRQQKAVAQAELAAWLQDPDPQSLEVDSQPPPGDVPAELDALAARAEQCNPELRGLLWQIRRDHQREQLADLQRYPDFSVGIQYGFMSDGGAVSPVAEGNDMLAFSAGMTLPIWRNKIQAGVSEAAAARRGSEELYGAEQLSIAGRLRSLFAQAQSLAHQRDLFQTGINPKLEQALRVATSEYSVGKTSFAELVDGYTQVLEFQLQTARIEASLAGVLAQIEATAGCPELVAPAQ